MKVVSGALPPLLQAMREHTSVPNFQGTVPMFGQRVPVQVSSKLMTQTKDEANTEARESGFELISAFITKDSQL